MVLHGNKYLEKEFIRNDFGAADMTMTRLVVILAGILGFETSSADNKGALMQIGPFFREVYLI